MKRVEITVDHVNGVIRQLTEMTRQQVLVGIPDSTTTRENEEGQPVTNAALGYIHEFGSPAAGIPARPFLIPGVKQALREVTAHLRKAAQAALDNRPSYVQAEMVAAGIAAELSAKREIHTGNFVPLKPSTIRNRRRSRDTQSRRQSEERYMEMVVNNVSPEEAQAIAGIRPLINTGQLANAITSVVRRIGSTTT